MGSKIGSDTIKGAIVGLVIGIIAVISAFYFPFLLFLNFLNFIGYILTAAGVHSNMTVYSITTVLSFIIEGSIIGLIIGKIRSS